MFTRQHYKAIADIFAKTQILSLDESILIESLIDEFVDLFEADNSNFDAEKFAKFCKQGLGS